jgi:hypothetical protein
MLSWEQESWLLTRVTFARTDLINDRLKAATDVVIVEISFLNPLDYQAQKLNLLWKGQRFLVLVPLIGVGLGFLVSPFAEASHSPSALSAPPTLQSETLPNQPIIIPELPSPLLSQVIEPLVTEGPGSLNVFNGTSQDAYIKLIDPLSDELVASFYVQSNSTFTLEEIPDGTYEVIFTSGENWDSNTRSFTMSKSFARFDDPLDFNTILLADGGTEYRTYELTLHSVENGNAQTSGVSEQESAQY